LGKNQCDQLGRFFAYVEIVTFGSFLKITEAAEALGLLFPW
jgi:hypothetical protein